MNIENVPPKEPKNENLEAMDAEASKKSPQGKAPERSTAELNYAEIIKPENVLEEQILNDIEWQQGAAWEKPRIGHPEVKIISHIVEVLGNIDRLPDVAEHERAQLRLIAILHDAFKYRVDMSKPKFGENHHGALAKKFAEKYTQDEVVLKIIQRHDDAFNAWHNGNETGKWEQAEKRVQDLIMKKIGRDNLRLYLLFYQCDNETGIKSQESLQWFKEKVKEL